MSAALRVLQASTVLEALSYLQSDCLIACNDCDLIALAALPKAASYDNEGVLLKQLWDEIRRLGIAYFRTLSRLMDLLRLPTWRRVRERFSAATMHILENN